MLSALATLTLLTAAPRDRVILFYKHKLRQREVKLICLNLYSYQGVESVLTPSNQDPESAGLLSGRSPKTSARAVLVEWCNPDYLWLGYEGSRSSREMYWFFKLL
jgi:hypothetical protein